MRRIREWQRSNKPGKNAIEHIYDCSDDGEGWKRDLVHWVQCRTDGSVIALSLEDDRQVFRLLDRDADRIRKWVIPLNIQPGANHEI